MLLVPIETIFRGCFNLLGGISFSSLSKGGSVAFLRVVPWDHNGHVPGGMDSVR